MKTKAPPNPNRSGFLLVENDMRRVYWEYFGQGDREVVVMLNGVAMSTRGWYRNLPELQPGFDVLLYDYLGQGRSSQEDEPYHIDHFAEYLVRIMDTLGVERIHPVGVSYGGFIAAELGRLFQDRLHTLTLSGILLTRETQFRMYQDLSLLFYRSPDPAFEIYTHYMYEKIFGEAFASRLYGDKLERMRQGFFDDYHGKEYCLIRLTEAQNPFFARIDADPDAVSRHPDADVAPDRRPGPGHPALAAGQAAGDPAQCPPNHGSRQRPHDLHGATGCVLAGGEGVFGGEER